MSIIDRTSQLRTDSGGGAGVSRRLHGAKCIFYSILRKDRLLFNVCLQYGSIIISLSSFIITVTVVASHDPSNYPAGVLLFYFIFWFIDSQLSFCSGMKWLDWNDYLVVCQELKKECALLSSSSGGNKERPRKHVAWSLQRYLIFSILASVPDRQRTLRELEIGRTLIKEGDKWVIRHGPKDYKTGKSYGERPPLLLSPSMYPELEAFIATWRAELEPQHNFLFTQENKQPFSDSQLSKFFMVTAYRLTGQRLTPHLVRDSIVTFLRRGNATERELESLALYMGHSIEMQRSSYDRRTKDEKVGPAVALLEAMNDDFLAKT